MTLAESSGDRPTSGDVSSVLRLIGQRVLVVHQPSGPGEEPGLSGTDVDCAVFGLDPAWPLRLDEGWAMRQCLRYGLRNSYWVLEKDGLVVPIDAFDDPTGLERDCFPTTLLATAAAQELAPAVRGAYLTAKRIRKGMPDEKEWRRIGELARGDPGTYRGALEEVFGRLSGQVGSFGLDGVPPDARTWRRAATAQYLRRFRTPGRAVRALALRIGRVQERLRHPTGLLVVIAGPDGCGKSSLAGGLPDACRGFFRREAKFHWRPGLLPRPGTVLGRPASDPSTPHARPAYGRTVSLALLGYYWTDFVLGGWIRIWPVRVRSGLVVMERGWHDIAVDPLRYRLQVPTWLVRALDKPLLTPDVTLVLDAPPRQLRERKAELPEEELARQLESWRHVPPAKLATVRLDASRTPGEVLEAARHEVLAALEQRTVSWLGPGWVGLPSAGAARWRIPRGPRATTLAALDLYQPMTPRARLVWEAARLFGRAGGFRLLPRGDAPAAVVRQAVASHVPPRGSLAVARLSLTGRYLVRILDQHGTCLAVAKVVTSGEHEAKLAREAEAFRSVAGLLPAPLRAPRILAQEPRALILEAVPWQPRQRPWELMEDVAFALGVFFKAGGGDGSTGAAHGDCAPWNLLQTNTGWCLVDWEEASMNAMPFQDVCHFLVQAHALLHRPSEEAVIEGFLLGRGPVGRAVAAYADGAGLSPGDAAASLRHYLQASQSGLSDAGRADERAGLAARGRLLRLLDR